MSDRYHVRWMIARDMPCVCDIEQRCFEFPWSRDDFGRALRCKNCVGLVVLETIGEDDRKWNVVGYTVYVLYKTEIQVLNFAIHPEWQRTGAGTALMQELMGKLTTGKRRSLLLEVRETNVAAQVWLRGQGFRVVNTLHDHYAETDDDAYLFQFRLPQYESVK